MAPCTIHKRRARAGNCCDRTEGTTTGLGVARATGARFCECFADSRTTAIDRVAAPPSSPSGVESPAAGRSSAPDTAGGQDQPKLNIAGGVQFEGKSSTQC